MNYYHSHYIKEISICSLSDQYSENIPINPIRRVYEKDNERKFRYVSDENIHIPCRIYDVIPKKGLVALNSYCFFYRFFTVFSLLHEFFKSKIIRIRSLNLKAFPSLSLNLRMIHSKMSKHQPLSPKVTKTYLYRRPLYNGRF